MLKKLTVQLKSSVLSEFDSDTTLGIFCWRLKQLHGEEKLEAFLNRYKEDKPVFTITNELFEINENLFFPCPVYIPKINKQTKSKKEKINNMLLQKENSSRDYISLRQLNAFLDGDIEEYNKKEENISYDTKHIYKLIPGFESELRVGVEIDRISSRSKDGQLFSYHPKFLKEGNKLAFLIKILDTEAFDKFYCERILKTVFEIGYGKKKSSGYGHCQVISFDEFSEIKQPEDSKAFLTLSNYLPAKSDNIISGFYDTFIKYGKLGEELSSSKIPFKKPILFIKPGAIFFTNNSKKNYGRITEKSEISPANNFVVQFGIPFTLNINYTPNDK